MAEVLTYPLTAVPLSHVKWQDINNREVFANEKHRRATTIPPFVTDQTVIDASFFLYLQKDLPVIFGKIAIILLQTIMAFDGNTIHFVTDKWLQPSIKDSKMDVRNSTQASYQIKGPEQKRPSNWTDSMKNPIALNKDLIDAWRDNSLAGIFGTKTLHANPNPVVINVTNILQMELKLFVKRSLVYLVLMRRLTLMFHHVAFSNCENHCSGPVNIVVRTNDTGLSGHFFGVLQSQF